MLKEYRTIREIAGPLMVVSGVEGVTYDELGEIELPSGETRRCKVLEVDGDNAVVQLFESSAGINLRDSKVRFAGATACSCWRFRKGYAGTHLLRHGPPDRRRTGNHPGPARRRQRRADEPGCPRLSKRVYSRPASRPSTD